MLISSSSSSSSFKSILIPLVAVVFFLSRVANVGAVVPSNVTGVSGADFFTYIGTRAIIEGLKDGGHANANQTAIKVMRASVAEFPALNCQGVSMAVFQFPPSSLNPPHVNTRSTGLLLVISGTLKVGLIDENNKLFTQMLQAGDMFVFPKALVHYQYNPDAETTAVAVAAFGSTSAGTVSIPSSVFSSGVDVNVLAKAFKTSVPDVQKIEAGLMSKT